jgi:hypothetical protein
MSDGHHFISFFCQFEILNISGTFICTGKRYVLKNKYIGMQRRNNQLWIEKMRIDGIPTTQMYQ